MLERTVFFLASGPSVMGFGSQEVSLLDVAVTALAHLGIEADPTWQLDGKVLGLANR